MISTKCQYKPAFSIGVKYLRRVVSLPREHGQHAKQAAADDHVQGVHAGHGEIEREEQFGFFRIDRNLLAVVVKRVREGKGGSGDVVLLKFFRVLDRL